MRIHVDPDPDPQPWFRQYTCCCIYPLPVCSCPQVEFQVKETSLDFSKIRTAAMSLFNNRGEILRHGNLSLAKNPIKKMFCHCFEYMYLELILVRNFKLEFILVTLSL